MSARTFIDTNVFVYADDDDQPAKRDIARARIRQLVKEKQAVVSTQVLMEYVAAGRRRLGLTISQCREKVVLLSRLDVALIKSEHVLSALDLAAAHSFSQWDALVVKSAATSGCQFLLTEDMQDGQVIDGVTIQNPFKAVT